MVILAMPDYEKQDFGKKFRDYVQENTALTGWSENLNQPVLQDADECGSSGF
jgi:hypothetical protein